MIRLISLALLVSTMATGLFTGLLWTFAIGVDPMYARLDGPTYAQVQQIMIQTIDEGIPVVLALTALGPLVALGAMIATRRWRTRAFALTLVAFVLFIGGVMIFTVTLNVPINNYVLSWDPAAPPADWSSARERWDQLNAIRTPIAIIAFALYSIALTQPLAEPDTANARATSRRTLESA